MLSDDRGLNLFSIQKNRTSYCALKVNNLVHWFSENATGPTDTVKCHSWIESGGGSHLFADFSPGLLQSVDGATVEGWRDLQHSVVIIEAAADVRHSDPLLYGAGPGAHVGVGHNLWGHQVAHLVKENGSEYMRGDAGLNRATGCLPETYIIEVLTGFHYIWCPFHLIDLHPSLTQELSGRVSTDIGREFRGHKH